MKSIPASCRPAVVAAVLLVLFSAAAAQEKPIDNPFKEISGKYILTVEGVRNEVLFYADNGILKSKRENDPAGEIVVFKLVPGRTLAFEGSLAGGVPMIAEFIKDGAGLVASVRLEIQGRSVTAEKIKG